MTQTADPRAGTSPAGPQNRRLALIFLLGALTAVAPLSIDMYLPALPSLTEDLSTGAMQAQLTLTACVAASPSGRRWRGR